MERFPDQETEEFRKSLSEGEVLSRLQSDGLLSPSLRLVLLQTEVLLDSRMRVDAILEVGWGKHATVFGVECKSKSTPKTLEIAVAQAIRYAAEMKVRPMVVLPYLSEESLDSLEREGVSGIDLCGNGLVLGERFQFRRDGRPNRFTSSVPIKNVFRGTSSLFARCFLIQDRFASLSELREFALDHAERGGLGETDLRGTDPAKAVSKLAMGTASKVVQALAENLIVVKEGVALRLVDPPRLLDSLRRNYSIRASERLEVKTRLSEAEWWERLRKPTGRPVRHVMTGLSSALYYGLISTREKPAIYVDDLEGALERLEALPTSDFSSLRLVLTESDLPYFDPRERDGRILASPIQTWLEMATDGPRERDAARDLENDLVQGRSV